MLHIISQVVCRPQYQKIMKANKIKLTWLGEDDLKAVTVKATAGVNNIIIDWGDGNGPIPYNGTGDSQVIAQPIAYEDSGSHNVTVWVTGPLYQWECLHTGVTSIDVSECETLEDLCCSYNQLTELDVSHNCNLQILHCNRNLLTELDVKNNYKLWNLACSHNQLTELDISSNSKLRHVECGHNQFNRLDVSHNNDLTCLVIH